ncbi:MAG: SDR family NAD(P)-dependent oxidoreductase [Candidatus Limnocylindrales bacterium]
MAGRLSGKVCLITGSTGIAEAAAVRVAAEGAALFIASRTETHCRQLAERIALAGGRVAYRTADLTSEDDVVGAVAACAEEFGRIDGLFSVAGGSGRRFGDGPLHEIPLDGWEATFSLNLRGQFLVAREVVRRMLAQPPDSTGGRGSILLMGSISAFHPAPAHYATHAYAATKAAIAGLVATTAAYYAPVGIRVNALAPGAVTSPMSARAAADPPTVAYAARRQPLAGGFLAAADISGAAVFLLSDESRVVTGQVLGVDAGWSVSDASGWAGPAVDS